MHLKSSLQPNLGCQIRDGINSSIEVHEDYKNEYMEDLKKVEMENYDLAKNVQVER